VFGATSNGSELRLGDAGPEGPADVLPCRSGVRRFNAYKKKAGPQRPASSHPLIPSP